jgi:broad specificity phosphatase PhoE
MLPRAGVLALALLALPVQAQASEALWTPSGRDDARRIGNAFRARSITVDDVRSSVWCRCLDTATLAFGMANPWLLLNSFFRNREREAGQTGAVRELVSRHHGGRLILVTHQVNITALTGLYPAEGEMIVLTPRGGDFTVAGRVKPADVTQN